MSTHCVDEQKSRCLVSRVAKVPEDRCCFGSVMVMWNEAAHKNSGFGDWLWVEKSWADRTENEDVNKGTIHPPL
jgi:hypothetical protein